MDDDLKRRIIEYANKQAPTPAQSAAYHTCEGLPRCIIGGPMNMQPMSFWQLFLNNPGVGACNRRHPDDVLHQGGRLWKLGGVRRRHRNNPSESWSGKPEPLKTLPTLPKVVSDALIASERAWVMGELSPRVVRLVNGGIVRTMWRSREEESSCWANTCRID